MSTIIMLFIAFLWSPVCYLGPLPAPCKSSVTGRRENTFALRTVEWPMNSVSKVYWCKWKGRRCISMSDHFLFPLSLGAHLPTTHPCFTSTQSHQLQADPLICYQENTYQLALTCEDLWRPCSALAQWLSTMRLYHVWSLCPQVGSQWGIVSSSQHYRLLLFGLLVLSVSTLLFRLFVVQYIWDACLIDQLGRENRHLALFYQLSVTMAFYYTYCYCHSFCYYLSFLFFLPTNMAAIFYITSALPRKNKWHAT